jgi:hypothetical protein
MDDLPKDQLRIAIRIIAIFMMYPINCYNYTVVNLDLYFDLYFKLPVLKPVLPTNF